MARPTSAAASAWLIGLVLSAAAFRAGGVISIEDYGAVAGDEANPITNSDALQHAMAAAAAARGRGDGNVVLVPRGKEYTLVGTLLKGITNVVLQIDGTLKASQDFHVWPLQEERKPNYEHFLSFSEVSNITITSNSGGEGLVNGQGYPWWWAEILQTLPAGRPKLLNIDHGDNIVIENVTFRDSPNWTVNLNNVFNVTVRYITIETDIDSQKKIMAYARDSMSLRKGKSSSASSSSSGDRKREEEDSAASSTRSRFSLETSLKLDWKSLLVNLLEDLRIPTFPLNTDGIDIAGSNVYIHDSKIQNFDDSIAIKACNTGRCTFSNCSENILVERLVATGVGLSIGSVSPSDDVNCVRNITMRDISMPDTIKGIYIKTDPGTSGSGIVSDVLYENIEILRPIWWSIWIGPQQQHQPGWDWDDHQECSLDFPLSGEGHCPSQPLVPIENITLRNITIVDPLLSPGVLLCNESRLQEPGKDSCNQFYFENVTVHTSAGGALLPLPYGNQYACYNVGNSSAVNSSPEPDCFMQR